MRKYARFKGDGYIMAYSQFMDADKFDFFDWDGPVPEFITDLPLFLSGRADEAVTAKPAKKKAEPQFLRDASGNLATA